MTKIYELIEKAKTYNKVDSDYAIAKIIGVKGQDIYNWKIGRTKPDGINMLKILKAGNINVDTALSIVTEKAPTQGELSLSNSGSLYIM